MLRKQRSLLTIIAFAIATIILSGMTIIFGALPLRGLRVLFGRWAFLLVSTGLVAALWFSGLQAVAITVLALGLLIGIYTELEQLHQGVVLSGLVSTAVSASTGFFATREWLKSMGISLQDKIHEQMALFIGQADKMNSGLKIDIESLVSQVPSVLVCVMLIALAIALIYERRMYAWIRAGRDRVVLKGSLTEFRLPDFYVWIAMISFLFTFMNFNNKTLEVVAANIFNIMIVLYMFQGMAVVEKVFSLLRVPRILRAIVYVVVFLQLFLVLSAIGFADYWINIRKRFSNFKTNVTPSV